VFAAATDPAAFAASSQCNLNTSVEKGMEGKGTGGMVCVSVRAMAVPPKIRRLPRSGPAAPRPPWPSRAGGGSYCIQARCEVRDADGRLVGHVVGHDRYLCIAAEVEAAAAQVRDRDFGGGEAGEATIVFFACRKQCAGQVWFVCLDDKGDPYRLL
jgi:hypothetical protein